jgi:DNA-binding transcriptional ArsR family regulator
VETIRSVRAGAKRAQALSDPTRLSIALAIRDHPRQLVDQIAEEVGRHQSLVSRHCQKLYEAGLLDRAMRGHPDYALSDYGARLVRLVMEKPELH